jgi:hypothetical protein
MRSHRRRHRHDVAVVNRAELSRLVADVDLDPLLIEAALVQGIDAAARDDWTAAAWLLERTHPERWACRRSASSSS